MDNGGQSGGVKVVVRLRPSLGENVAGSLQQDGKSLTLSAGDSSSKDGSLHRSHTYQFDSVLGPECSQADVEKQCQLTDVLRSLMAGFHGTIFAYGQTGSGKTHTMDGYKYGVSDRKISALPPSAQDEGIIPRCIRGLFRLIEETNQHNGNAETSDSDSVQVELKQRHPIYRVRCSFIQIYQERVFDLLSGPASWHTHEQQPRRGSASAGLPVRWRAMASGNGNAGEFYVEGAYELPCESATRTLGHYSKGVKARVVAGHKLNAASSRSHSIFTLCLDRIDPLHPEQSVSSRLSLVDLAGSETIATTEAQGLVLQQSVGINKSLFALRNVIKAVVHKQHQQQQKSKGRVHVPYRDSVLTRLLQHSIGGNCHTLMIACVCPSDRFVRENISTLDYASLTQRITNRAEVNEDPKSKIIRQLRAEVAFLKQELLRARIDVSGLGTLQDNQSSGELLQSEAVNSTTVKSVDTGTHGVVATAAARSGFRSTSSVVEDRFIDSVQLIKELLEDNQRLRGAYVHSSSALESAEETVVELQHENDELRERLSFVESVLVDGLATETGRRSSEYTGPVKSIGGDASSDDDDDDDHGPEASPKHLQQEDFKDHALHEMMMTLRDENVGLRQMLVDVQIEYDRLKRLSSRAAATPRPSSSSTQSAYQPQQVARSRSSNRRRLSQALFARHASQAAPALAWSDRSPTERSLGGQNVFTQPRQNRTQQRSATHNERQSLSEQIIRRAGGRNPAFMVARQLIRRKPSSEDMQPNPPARTRSSRGTRTSSIGGRRRRSRGESIYAPT